MTGHPFLWVLSRRQYTLLPSPSPPPVTRGLTDTVPTQGAEPTPTARARSPNPTPSLETGWGKSAAAGSVATAPGEGARPCLRHSDPTGPCAPPWVRLGSAPQKRNVDVRPWRRPGCAEHAQPHRPLVSLSQQWFSPQHPQATAEAGGPGTIPLARRRGTRPGAGLVAMATGRSPRAELGAGRPREALPRAHIRTQEGVGPAPSRGPEPGPGSPGICQVPGRARAPGRLVPTSPAAAPEAPTAASLGPTQLLWGCVLPGPARPGRSPPARGPGSDFAPGPIGRGGAGQCLEAPPAPGRAGTTASFLGWGTFPPGGLGLSSHIPRG